MSNIRVLYQYGLEIKLFQKAEIIAYEVTSLQRHQTVTSTIAGFSFKDLSRCLAMPDNLLLRFLEIDKKSLKIAYVGLRGGGSCGSKKAIRYKKKDLVELEIKPDLNLEKKPPLITPRNQAKEEEIVIKESIVAEAYKQVEEEWQNENELFEANQNKAIEIAKTLSKAMSFGTIERPLIKKLSKISPYECSTPLGIAQALLINYNQNAFWAGPQYLDDRSAITTIIRRCLMVQIMKDPNRALFSKDSMNDCLNNLEEINNRIDINSDHPELCTKLEVAAIVRLISRSKSTCTWWRYIVGECSEILMIAVSLKKLNPGPLLQKICKTYRNISRKIGANYLDFMMELEVLEKKNSTTLDEDSINIIAGFLLHKIKQVSSMPWEEVHILMEFIVKFINNQVIGSEFVTEIFKAIEELSNHNEWRIREKCATVIRHLRSNEIEEIKTRASNLHQSMKIVELHRNDKHIGVLNILDLVPLRVRCSEEKKTYRHTTNIHGIKYLVGREHEITQISEHFKGNNLLALVGQGGIGKTAIALKYGQDSINLYKIVHEINCENENLIISGLASLAKALGLKCENKELIDSLRAEFNTLEDYVLIILDNAVDQEQIYSFFTNNQKVKFLASSRSQDWDSKIQILELSIEASVKFLKNRLGKDTDPQDLKILADILGNWPLALEQSTGIIMNEHYEIKKFIKSFASSLSRSQKMEQILKSGFTNISKQTRSLLKILAACNSQKIPEFMVKKLFSQKYDEDDWWSSRSVLINYYIVSCENNFWNIHRIIHGYIQKNYILKKYNKLVDFYTEIFAIDNSIWINEKKLKKVKALGSHVESLVKLIKIQSLQEFMLFYNLIYFYIQVEVNFKQATTYLERVLSDLVLNDFSQHDLAEMYKRIGALYGSQAEFKKSENFYKKSLEINQKMLQPNKIEIADILSGLGVLFYFKADYGKSEEYYLEALSIREKFLDKNHAEIASLYMNLGTLYRQTVKYSQGADYYWKAFQIQEHTLPPNHPDRASLLMNLGILYCNTSQFELSEDFFLKALKIREEILPPKHQDIATIYANLGNLYRGERDYEKSKEFYNKALKIREELLPPTHPDVANIYECIGKLYSCEEENFQKSEELYLKALKIKEEILPTNSPDLSNAYINLGNLYSAQPGNEKADDYYLKALTARKKYLDQYKPHISEVFMGLQHLYKNKINHDKIDSPKIKEELMLSKNLDIINIRSHLKLLYQRSGTIVEEDEYELLE